jgi:UDP-N-acetyl-D-mannosaminuronic acid transferase (WecB/TagA/CpsF family)
MANNQEKIILGVKITDLSWPEIIDEVNAMLSNQQQNLICTPNPEICLLAEENKTFQQLLNAAKICAPDGFGLKIGALILGQRLKNRITGVDLTVKLCEIAEQKICSMMFVGGQWNIASEAAEAMKKQFPNLKIAEERGLSKTWLADNKLFYDPQENERLIARFWRAKTGTLDKRKFGAPAKR